MKFDKSLLERLKYDFGKKCPIYLLESDEVNEYKSLLLFSESLKFTIFGFEQIITLSRNYIDRQHVKSSEGFDFINPKDVPHLLINKHLLYSSIVSYMKFFTRGTGIKRYNNNLEGKTPDRFYIDEFFTQTSPKITIHNEIRQLRNKHIAHNGKKSKIKAYAFLLLEPDISKKSVIGISNHWEELILPNNEKIKQFKEVSQEILNKINSNLKQITKAIFSKAQNEPVENFYNNLLFTTNDYN